MGGCREKPRPRAPAATRPFFATRTVALCPQRRRGTPRSWWAHQLSQPEPGCLLVAKPTEQDAQMGIFARCVVLVLGHDDRLGTSGFIINRPSGRRLRGGVGLDPALAGAGSCP
jgi:hypothetical protein